MDSPYWKGPLPGVDVQRRYLWKTFRGKPNRIPGSARKCSASARNPVRLHPGMLFGFSPESCSTCPGMLFGLPRNTQAYSSSMDQLAGLTDLPFQAHLALESIPDFRLTSGLENAEARKLALDRFRLIQPHVEQ